MDHVTWVMPLGAPRLLKAPRREHLGALRLFSDAGLGGPRMDGKQKKAQYSTG